MKKLNLPIKIVLMLVIIVLGYYLYRTLFDPYFFDLNKKKRYEAVKERLRDVATAQDAYKQMKGEYAADFDSLIPQIKTGDLMQIRTLGVETDSVQYINVPTAIELFNLDSSLHDSILFQQIEITLQDLYDRSKRGESVKTYIVKDTAYIPAISALSFSTSIDSIRYIPNSEGDVFELNAQVNYVGPGRVKVPVYEAIAYNSSILKGLNHGFYKSKEGIKLGSLSEASTDIQDIIILDDDK